MTLITAALIAGPAVATTIVVRAGGPSARAYPVGKPLSSSARIELKAGDVLTLLDAKGTRTLRGPGRFAADGARAPRTNASFAALVSTTPTRRPRGGFVRTGGEEALRPSSLWSIDVMRDSTVCLPAGTPVTLWRAKPTSIGTLTLRDARVGTEMRVSFPPSAASIPFPPSLSTTEGAAYTLRGPDRSQPRTIRFVALPPDLSDPARTAANLHARGCLAQFHLLVETMENGATNPAS